MFRAGLLRLRPAIFSRYRSAILTDSPEDSDRPICQEFSRDTTRSGMIRIFPLGREAVMPEQQRAEINANFSFFQEVVPTLIAQYRGQYALLRARAVIDIFPNAIDAATAGYHRFADGLFSVQHVIDRPVDLGFISYASGDRDSV
jgi:hypothetical protein